MFLNFKSIIQRAMVMLLAISAFGHSAHALDMMVWDKALQTKLAYGQTERSTGVNTLSGQVLSGVNGPIVVLFSLDETEKSNRVFSTLASRYEGEIKGGKLWLKLPNGPQSLDKFLATYGFKLELTPIKPAGTKLPTAESVALIQTQRGGE